MPDGPLIHMPGEGRVLNMGPFQMMVKADANQTDGALAVLEGSEPAHFGPPMHIHDDAAEAAETEATGRGLDTDELTTLAAHYAMRVIGPVPDGYL